MSSANCKLLSCRREIPVPLSVTLFTPLIQFTVNCIKGVNIFLNFFHRLAYPVTHILTIRVLNVIEIFSAGASGRGEGAPNQDQ